MSRPSKTKQFINTAKDVASHAAKTGEVRVPLPLFERRVKICFKCPKFEQAKWKCKVCGCNMKAKARFKAAKCPEGKWL